ncbi:pseudouridine synthase pus4 [Vermiconidia calcicola]|uniref:Pseudouridine synthase pus4 n=1 Tax=Vermiconidia calcicola TaxID=1690605 RepID=A0ACC3MDR5_9PEZI|nr:pseudouridine synthase pus4 [Vermiconidia calcicola]
MIGSGTEFATSYFDLTFHKPTCNYQCVPTNSSVTLFTPSSKDAAWQAKPTSPAKASSKPTSITSAQVIRDCQNHFKDSTFFQPWLEREQARKDADSHNQKQKRRSWKQRQPLQLKMGHGGTLDPMATGVLILGVGNGTKKLQDFLSCTKSYECVVLFGAATDTYDSVGKVVARKEYEHVTKEKVEAALGKFRGKVMQRPPIFSALRVQGKRLYEYAREGKEVPVEIQERPVEVQSLEMVEWMEGGTHQYHWPREEAEKETKEVVEKVLHLGDEGGPKRKRETDDANADEVVDAGAASSPKRSKTSLESAETQPNNEQADPTTSAQPQKTSCPAPACRLTMTVTSGFYVRTLCHDLGAALSTLGLMASLIRTRQGDFELGKNVLEYEDIDQGEGVWRPKVEEIIEQWQEREGVEVEGVVTGKGRVRAGRNSSSSEGAEEVKDPPRKSGAAAGG